VEQLVGYSQYSGMNEVDILMISGLLWFAVQRDIPEGWEDEAPKGVGVWGGVSFLISKWHILVNYF